MGKSKEKVFRDSVHGYIHVPEDWCKLLIDTPIFQRLRHIEQTSMRCLYPSARHCRFVHSLGVYYLGRRAFEHIVENSKKLINKLGIGTPKLEVYRQTFRAACLLHDCGHAPFSHTFEKFYDLGACLDSILLTEMKGDAKFANDLPACSPAAHEKVSAIVALRHFRPQLKRLGARPELIARMIIGCQYHGAPSNAEKFENSLITLLKGSSVDVDKLDYICRDTWASGVDNATIDIDRLLGAVTVAKVDSKCIVAFEKRAMSVLQAVVEGRNFLYRWIYNHHKVCYDQHLLKDAVEKVAKQLWPRWKTDRVLKKMFSLESFEAPVSIGGARFYLPTDGDLIYFMKRYLKKIPVAEEWLSRVHTKKAVWKTIAEYDRVFEKQSVEDRTSILRGVKEGKLAKWLLTKGCTSDFLIEEPESKQVEILNNQLFIVLAGELVSYTELFERHISPHLLGPAFYLYLPDECKVKRSEIIKFLKTLV
jgi:hypothetical protein